MKMSSASKTIGKRLTRSGLALYLLVISACGQVSSPSPDTSAETNTPEQVDPQANINEINNYLRNLDPRSGELLNVQETGSSDRKNELIGSPETTTEDIPGQGNYTCTRENYNLQQNFDEVAILRPTQGIVWPGALIKANQSLTDGLPEPITLQRSPVTLSLDLPGIGSNGTKVIENPTHSSVQTAVDEALEWWNTHAYEDGYVNAASSSFQWTSSYDAQQTSLAVGLNLAWASGDVSTALSTSSSQTNKVVTGVFKQAFYTVTADTPSAPTDVLAPDMTLDGVQSQINDSAPGAYISNVTYGRIISVKMESSSSESVENIEGAFNYSMGVQSAGNLASTYERILEDSTFTVVTLGGNAAVATKVLDPSDYAEGFLDAIKGDNALYSRSNPGVPISYTVRYLKDNTLAQLGATTEYTTTECVQNSDQVTVEYKGIKVLGDCRLFEGYFYWNLGAIAGKGYESIAQRSKNNALLGDDVAGTYFRLNASETYTMPKAPGSAITLKGDVYESLTGTHFPIFSDTLSYDNGWKQGSHSLELNPTGKVGVSACNVQLDYAITVQ